MRFPGLMLIHSDGFMFVLRAFAGVFVPFCSITDGDFILCYYSIA